MNGLWFRFRFSIQQKDDFSFEQCVCVCVCSSENIVCSSSLSNSIMCGFIYYFINTLLVILYGFSFYTIKSTKKKRINKNQQQNEAKHKTNRRKTKLK